MADYMVARDPSSSGAAALEKLWNCWSPCSTTSHSAGYGENRKRLCFLPVPWYICCRRSAVGLTIHYELTVPNKWSIATVREKLEALRQACMDLPVVDVSELREFKGDECQLGEDKDEPFRWAKTQAARQVEFSLGTRLLLLPTAAPHDRVRGRCGPRLRADEHWHPCLSAVCFPEKAGRVRWAVRASPLGPWP